MASIEKCSAKAAAAPAEGLQRTDAIRDDLTACADSRQNVRGRTSLSLLKRIERRRIPKGR